ncbi:hypothetical protein LTR62_001893 [Meristemomyces frigidus]|uniref:ubiquitinyl hydrolase 1 n=1 Tax=Meristemomyces frigidus TaxID=1508187 RepID=A0AAN7YG17_9PEZI|nr:hypothetical protein LTR62_001893 [Meristemomyces frigidus]
MTAGKLGSFLPLRLLGDEARDVLLAHFVDDPCQYGTNGLPVARQTKSVRRAIRRYTTTIQLTEQQIDEVEDSRSDSFYSECKPMLLLLRRSVAGGLLDFAFGQKGGRVIYGTTQSRVPSTRLAVPFVAKDDPGAWTDAEYQLWVQDARKLPRAFATIRGTNLQDQHQCQSDTWPHLHFAKGAIDDFLSHVVFPKEMKEFSHKISVSGWDIGEVKGKPTTVRSEYLQRRPLAGKDLRYHREKVCRLEFGVFRKHARGFVVHWVKVTECSYAPRWI